MRRVTVVSGQVATVNFNNTLKHGTLMVTKTSEDGLNEGVKFHLYGTSLSGLAVDEYAVTDSTGKAVFSNVLIGTGYTLEEVDTAIRYVVPEQQTAAVEWNTVTNKSFTNILKKWNVTVTKSDAETGLPQGDATLAGAVYGIYKGDQLVGTYTTDANGQFTTKYYVCGDDWTIREITPSEGYLLDSTCREFVVENGKIDGKSELSVTVENDGTHLTIEKIDAESGKRISGAKLVLKDMDGNRVDSWISGGSGPHELEKLKPGSYVLVEEAAPDGYLAAEPVSFVLEAKQEVQTVTMKDLACETLTITKKIKADEITWAHGNPTFLFSVKGKDLYGKEHTYQCYLTFTKTQVEKTTDQDGYTEQSVQIRGIPAGNDYRVQEKKVLRYSLMQVTGTKNVTVKKLEEPAYGKDPARVFSVSVNLCGHPKESEVVFENQKYRWDDYGHNSIVKNRIPVE